MTTATNATALALLIMHEHLLGTEEYMAQLLAAIRKVTDNPKALQALVAQAPASK